MKSINRYEIHCLVEYIKSTGELNCDSESIVTDLQEILAGYGFYRALDRDSYLILADELLGLAIDAEFREVLRLAELELICGQDRLGIDYRIPYI